VLLDFHEFFIIQDSKKYAKNLPPIAREMLYVFFTKELGQILENGLAVKRDKLLSTDLKNESRCTLKLRSKIFVVMLYCFRDDSYSVHNIHRAWMRPETIMH